MYRLTQSDEVALRNKIVAGTATQLERALYGEVSHLRNLVSAWRGTDDALVIVSRPTLTFIQGELDRLKPGEGIEGIHGIGEANEPPLCPCGKGYVGHADHATDALEVRSLDGDR